MLGGTCALGSTSRVHRICTPCSIFWVSGLIEVYGKLNDSIFKDRQTLEAMKDTSLLNYFTHFVIRQFENLSLPINDPKRFRLEIRFSTGCVNDIRIMNFNAHNRPIKKYLVINNEAPLNDFLKFLEYYRDLTEDKDQQNDDILN